NEDIGGCPLDRDRRRAVIHHWVLVGNMKDAWTLVAVLALPVLWTFNNVLVGQRCDRSAATLHIVDSIPVPSVELTSIEEIPAACRSDRVGRGISIREHDTLY